MNDSDKDCYVRPTYTTAVQVYSVIYMLVCLPLLVGALYSWHLRLKEGRSPNLAQRSFVHVCVIGGLWGTNMIVRPLQCLIEIRHYMRCFGFHSSLRLPFPVIMAVQLSRVWKWTNHVKFNQSISNTTRIGPKASLEQKILKRNNATGYNSRTLVYLLVLALGWVFLVVYFNCKDPGLFARLCQYKLTVADFGVEIFMGFCNLLLILYAKKLSNQFPDPYNFIWEIQVAVFSLFFGFLAGAVLVVLFPPDFSDNVFTIDASHFSEQFFVGFMYMSLIYPLVQNNRLRARKAPPIPLDQILQSETTAAVFREYLVSELSIENLNFHEAVKSFKKMYNDLDQVERLKQAIIICDRFIAPDANEYSVEINISQGIKQDILKVLKMEQTDYEMFDRAHCEVYRIMEFDSFPRFCKVAMYKDIFNMK